MLLQVATHQRPGMDKPCRSITSPWKHNSKAQTGWQGAARGKDSVQRGLCSQKLLCQGSGRMNTAVPPVGVVKAYGCNTFLSKNS